MVVPDVDVLPGWAETHLGTETDSMEELCADERVKKAIFEDIVKVGKAGGLKGFEQVSRLVLLAGPGLSQVTQQG